MAAQDIQLQFPLGGLAKRSSYQDSRSDYTTPAAMNVWPDCALLERERPGSRPGLDLVNSMSGSAVNLIADVSYAPGGTFTNKIVAAAGGTLYYWTGTTFSSAGSVSSSKNLGSADIGGLLFIAGGTQVSVFNPSTNGVSDLSGMVTEGTAPTNCRLAANFNNRLVLAGDPSNPQNAYFSAMDDQTDWDYSPAEADIDPTDAFALNLSDQGRIGEPIRALIQHSSSCLLFGCDSSIWAMRGDPLDGGKVVNISNSIGMHSGQSWCYDPDGWLYFLSQDGIYVMEPGCGSSPRSISRERLPQELMNIDRSTNTVSMAYDLRYRGVIVGVTKNSGTSTHWWVDTRMAKGGDSATGAISFWPMQFTSLNPTACFRLRNLATTGYESTTWMGTSNGKIVRFDIAEDQDDGAAFHAYLDIGPFPVAATGRDGILTKLQVSLAKDSEDVIVSVRTGKTAQAAFNATAATSAVRTMSADGLNPTWHTQRRGPSVVVRCESNGSGAGPWALESIVATRQDAGMLRY